MARRVLLVVAVGLAWGVGGTSHQARAGVSYALVFRSTGTDQIDFASVAAARSATVVSDIFLVTTDALIAHGISVGWEDDLGLQVGSAAAWWGIQVAGGVKHGPIFGHQIACDGSISGPSPPTHPYCSSFYGFTPLPNAPPSLPPGTYNVGTIVWDTTGIEAGQTSIFPFLLQGIDATGVVLQPGYNIVDVTGSEVLYPAIVNVIPEPATATLLGLGLLGLLLARRRRGA
jgi:hypothetical protein